jgi:type II secretory pathway pseudopilin PulG
LYLKVTKESEENMNIKEKTSKKSGITLIALVITIIVLLILAGVSVATLTGDNGILTQAQSAKEQAQIAEIVEKAQLDIVEIQTQNNGEFTITDLTDILNKYFKDVPDTLPNDLSTLTLTTKEEYGNHSIKVSQIHNHNYVEIGELKDCSSEIKEEYKFKDVEITGASAYGNESIMFNGSLSVGDVVYVKENMKAVAYNSPSYGNVSKGYHIVTVDYRKRGVLFYQSFR